MLELIIESNDRECTKCKNVFKANEKNFYKQKRNNKKHGEHYKLSSECKSCLIERSLNHQEKNLEYHRIAQRKYSYTEKGIINRKKTLKKYRDSGLHKAYYYNNPERFVQYRKDRAERNHIISDGEWEACKTYFGYACSYCGISEESARKKYGHRLHKEHVINDGEDDLSNCVPACRQCNREKSDIEFEHWYKDRSGKYNEEKHKKIVRWLSDDYLLFVDSL